MTNSLKKLLSFDTKISKKLNSMNTAAKDSPNVGAFIKDFIKSKLISQAALARELGVQPSAVINYMNKPSIATKTLWKLCHNLQRNFFMDIALLLPPAYKSKQNPYESRDKRIAELELQVFKLETEKAVLMELKR